MQWHQLGHMQVCTSLQTDNHASTPPLSCYRPEYRNTDCSIITLSPSKNERPPLISWITQSIIKWSEWFLVNGSLKKFHIRHFSVSATPDKTLPLYLVKDRRFPEKLAASHIANCCTRQQLKFQTSKIADTVKNVHHMCAPNIVKTGWFLAEIFKRYKVDVFVGT